MGPSDNGPGTSGPVNQKAQGPHGPRYQKAQVPKGPRDKVNKKGPSQ